MEIRETRFEDMFGFITTRAILGNKSYKGYGNLAGSARILIREADGWVKHIQKRNYRLTVLVLYNYSMIKLLNV